MPHDPAPRNPALLVAPGTRARLELHRAVPADVVRGAAPGPTVWLWVVRGDEDPALQQALGELRDALDPARLRGAVGLLFDGPTPPIGRESYPLSHVARALSHEAAAIVLLCGAPAGHRATPHAACDVTNARERRIARELALPFVTPPLFQPPLNRALLEAPLVWLVAGEGDRMERTVVDTVREALSALLGAEGLLPAAPTETQSRLVRSLATVPLPQPGLVELCVEPGARLRRGAVVATVGEPGQARQALRAPCSGVLLSARPGHLLDGAVAMLGRLPSSEVTTAAVEGPREELGWCELVDLPELGIKALPAKVDTGARTSALHVHSHRFVGDGERGRPIYEIEVPAGESAPRGARTVRAHVEVIEQAVVRDSGGHAERRLVIETPLRLGSRLRRVRLSLTDRGDMRFPMLVGRTALDAHTRIDPTRTFLTRPTRRRHPR